MTIAFDSTEVALLSRALDRAWLEFGHSGLKNGDADAVVRAALTRAIVEAADQGERDESKLTAYALAHYERSKADITERDTFSRGT
jgi:hypothetical protein